MTQAAFAADCITAWFGIIQQQQKNACVRTAHTLHLNLKVCVARSGRVCGVATHAAGMDAGYGLLLEVIGRLKGKGNSIVIIEHNLDVIKTADWIVDLGPEGGDGGGGIIASGSPEKVAKVKGGLYWKVFEGSIRANRLKKLLFSLKF